MPLPNTNVKYLLVDPRRYYYAKHKNAYGSMLAVTQIEAHKYLLMVRYLGSAAISGIYNRVEDYNAANAIGTLVTNNHHIPGAKRLVEFVVDMANENHVNYITHFRGIKLLPNSLLYSFGAQRTVRAKFGNPDSASNYIDFKLRGPLVKWNVREHLIAALGLGTNIAIDELDRDIKRYFKYEQLTKPVRV